MRSLRCGIGRWRRCGLGFVQLTGGERRDQAGRYVEISHGQRRIGTFRLATTGAELASMFGGGLDAEHVSAVPNRSEEIGSVRCETDP